MLTPNDLVEKDLVKKGLDASSTHPESSKVVAATGGEVGLATIAVPSNGANAQPNLSTTEVVLAAMEPAPAVVSAVVSAPIVVSVDENLLALLRGESEQKSPAQKFSPAAMSASAGSGALSSIGGSPLSKPEAPSLLTATTSALPTNSLAANALPPHQTMLRGSRSFGAGGTNAPATSGLAALSSLPPATSLANLSPRDASKISAPATTSRRMFAPADTEPGIASPVQESSAQKRAGEPLSAAAMPSIESALQLPVSHLSSSFGNTWNGVERRRSPRVSPLAAAAAAAPGAKSSEDLRLAETARHADTDCLPGLVLYQGPPPNRMRQFLLWGATAATVAGMAFFFGFSTSGNAKPTAVAGTQTSIALASSPLHLQVEARGKSVDPASGSLSASRKPGAQEQAVLTVSMIGIRWDPECLPVLNAQSGKLIVIEGDRQPREILLQPAQLKIGHIYYETTFEQVEFRMEVQDSAGTITRESFLALLPGQDSGSAQAGNQKSQKTDGLKMNDGLRVTSPGAPPLPAANQFLKPSAQQVSPASSSQRGAASLALARLGAEK